MQMLRKFVFIVFISLSPTLFANEAVDINTADKEMLMSVNGIGEKRAEDIISYRKENGEFMSVQELTNIKGIGQSMVDRNKDILTVGTSAE